MVDRIKVEAILKQGMRALCELESIKDSIDAEHIRETPERVVKALFEMLQGHFEDPRDVLKKSFKNGRYDEILYVNDISFVSLCAHHALPFFGKCHFGYLPGEYIVGLSKIPRLIEVYSKRLQIQEQLTIEIVDTFNEALKPKGCGLVIEAYHLCMAIRGVENESAYTKSTALRGVFANGTTKQEFLDGIRKTTEKIWP